MVEVLCGVCDYSASVPPSMVDNAAGELSPEILRVPMPIIYVTMRSSLMAGFTQDMVDVVENAKLAFVATVRPDGRPNLSPKGSVRVLDSEHLIFADMASPQTVENLRHRPDVEVNVVDFLSRRGYRFRGTAEILEAGHADFDWIAAWVRSTHGADYVTHHAVKIAVTETAELLSPAYTIGHVQESDLRPAWIKKYGLREG